VPFPLPLRTDRLRLRLHHPDDLDWMVAVHSRPDVARFLLDDPWTVARGAEVLDKRLARTDLDGEEGAVALILEHDGAPVGDISLWLTDREHRSAEIGWVLDPAHTGRGFAREAVRTVLTAGFDHGRLHRVVAQMDARNTASARLADAVGMRREAHFRQDFWSKGEWTDSFVYAVLASDPRP